MLDKVSSLLTQVGERILTWRERSISTGRWEGTQLKTAADFEAHRMLARGLTEILSVPCISEEDAASHGPVRHDTHWLLDPIDGTASFAEGYSGFVTQVALMVSGRPVLGVVHAPALDLTYRAERSGRATCNGAPIYCTPSVQRRPILVDNYPEPRGVSRMVYDKLGCENYLESGSIGLKICRIADGSADIFVKDVTIRDWDVAPGELILSRAGGFLLTMSGDPIPYQGLFERRGLIAAGNQEVLSAALNCTRDFLGDNS